MTFFNSCESNEKKEKRHVNESFQSLEECINDKNVIGFKALFNSSGVSSLSETTIEEFFAVFSEGITLHETQYDDYITVTYWINGNYSDKNICWAREIVNNSTGEIFGVSVLEYTSESPGEDVGIIRFIVYPVEKEGSFDNWWNNLEDEDKPNGLILYDN